MTEKLRYCIDTQVLQGDSRDRGIGRYSSDLARAIIKSGRVIPQILLNTALKDGFYRAKNWSESLVDAKNIHVFHGLDEIMGVLPENDRRRVHAGMMYDAFVRRLNPNCLHIGAPFDGMGDNTAIGGILAHDATIRSATLYDLIPFQDSELHLADVRYHRWYHERLARLREFDILFAISSHTRKVAVESFGFPADRIVNISSDASDLFKTIDMVPAKRAKVLNRYGVTRSFIVHTGILETRKNVKLLIEAYAKLPASIRQVVQLVLVAAATEAQRAEIAGQARRFGLQASDIVFAGFVPDDDLVEIYNLASLLIMPSLSEGFGLPLLEAMRCGLPVLGANATSIPEVVGDKLYLFDPYDPGDLANRLEILLTNDAAYAKAKKHALKQQSLFSWRSSADKCLDAIEALREANAVQVLSGPVSAVTRTQTRATEIRIADESLTPIQEAVMSSGPFICIAPLQGDIACSSEMLYRSSGYYALYQQRFSQRQTLDRESLKNVSGCLDLFGLDELTSEKMAGGYATLQPMCDFISSVSGTVTEGEAVELSWHAYNNLMPLNRGATLFVDVSELSRQDSGTGIQRVVRNILHLLLTMPNTLRIEPIYRDGDQYRYARKFTADFLGLNALQMPDDGVFFCPGDIFLGLDLDALISGVAMERLSIEQRRGVRLTWVVYDLLPILKPEWFDAGLAGAVQNWVGHICQNADQLICISRSVADDVYKLLAEEKPKRTTSIDLAWWHLGADIGAVRPVGEEGVIFNALSAIPEDMPVFLTVGTIEPRKGIDDLLDNAETLWASGLDACFVLAGRRGWAVDDLIRRIEGHPELGRRLFWFVGAPDSVLHQLYTRATAAILPSRGEGFGLPLVEAAGYGTSIIARDLPVFREIGGEGAYYFADGEMADRIRSWLDIRAHNCQPDPRAVKQLTWADSTSWLYDSVVGSVPYMVWRPD